MSFGYRPVLFTVTGIIARFKQVLYPPASRRLPVAYFLTWEN